MPFLRNDPNQYAAEDTASSTTPTGHALTFNAHVLQLRNDKSVPVYVSLGTTAWSTGGFRTCAGESLEVAGVRFSRLSVASTATSTAGQVRILALGG